MWVSVLLQYPKTPKYVWLKRMLLLFVSHFTTHGLSYSPINVHLSAIHHLCATYSQHSECKNQDVKTKWQFITISSFTKKSTDTGERPTRIFAQLPYQLLEEQPEILSHFSSILKDEEFELNQTLALSFTQFFQRGTQIKVAPIPTVTGSGLRPHLPSQMPMSKFRRL